MKAMQEMIAALSKQQTPQAASLAPPTSQPTPLAAPMPPPAPLTPQPVTPAPQPTPPTPQPTPPVPVLGPTEMMVLGSDILDVVKQLDLAAVEEVETSGTSWEEMVAAEEPNCQAVEYMLLGDSNEDAPSAASQEVWVAFLGRRLAPTLRRCLGHLWMLDACHRATSTSEPHSERTGTTLRQLL